ncbi:hypothetical protein [Escherichia coli]|nr:hypothetical protein [Escherichia coli]
MKQIKELQRLLGKKTMENELLKITMKTIRIVCWVIALRENIDVSG